MRLLDSRPLDYRGRIISLTQNTSRARLFFSGFLSGLVLNAILAGFLALLQQASASSRPFLLDATEAIILATSVLLLASGAAWGQKILFRLKKESRAKKARRARQNLKLLTHLVSFALAGGLVSSLRLIPNPERLASLILTLVLALGLTILGELLWWQIFRLCLTALSPADWRLAIDKEQFSQALRTRFDESHRYGIPLSVLLVEIKNLPRKVGRRALIRSQEQVIQHIKLSLRAIDIVARLEQGEIIGIILHAPAKGSRIAAQRLIQDLGEQAWQAGSEQETGAEIAIGLASWDPAMQHELEIYQSALNSLKKEKIISKS